MSTLTNWIDKTFYPNHKDHWDNIMFREITLKYINKKTVLLDAGAGSGYLPQMNFKDVVGKAIGVDPSVEVKNNPFLHESHIGFCNDMPFLESNSIDVAVSNNVLEHVEEPNTFLKEVQRVLKPGGLYVVKTPNIYHYMALISTITPNWFHVFYNKLRGVPAEDIFPTQYKINCKKDLYDHAKKAGFTVQEFRLVEGRPEYLRIFAPFYLVGIVYEKIVNMFNLSQLKIVYFAVLKKEA
jgi:SAM-dependent methyltransferase